MKNTQPKFVFDRINGEVCLLLTFDNAEWIDENLWISDRDLGCAGLLDAVPNDLRIAISFNKLIDALKIAKEYRQTLREVQIDCNVSSQHFDSNNKSLWCERVVIEHPIAGHDFDSEFYIRFTEYDTNFDYELAISWEMLGLSHCETLDDINKELLRKASAEEVIICFE